MRTSSVRALFVAISLLMMSFAPQLLAANEENDYVIDPVRATYKTRASAKVARESGVQAMEGPQQRYGLTVARADGTVAGGVAAQAAEDEPIEKILKVKFRDGVRLTIVDGEIQHIADLTQADLATQSVSASVLEALPVGSQWEPLYRQPVDDQVRDWKTAEAYWKEQLPDPRTYFLLRTPVSYEVADAFVEQLNELAIVESAEIAPQAPASASQSEGSHALLSTAASGPERTPDATCGANNFYLCEHSIANAWEQHGLAGAGATVVLGAQGVPTGLKFPMRQHGYFGTGADGGDFDNAWILQESLPQIQPQNQNDPRGLYIVPMFYNGVFVPESAIESVKSLPRGSIVILPWHYILCGGSWSLGHWVCWPGYGQYSVPLEVHPAVFYKIKEVTALGYTVVSDAGYSDVDLVYFTTNILPNMNAPGNGTNGVNYWAHQPFVNPSGSVLVGQGPRANRGPGVYRAADYSSNRRATGPAMIGAVAALVQSGISRLHTSTDEHQFSPFGGYTALNNAVQAITYKLTSLESGRSIRLQSALPNAVPTRHGWTFPIPNFASGEHRILTFSIFNDGAQSLQLSHATINVAAGINKNACQTNPPSSPPQGQLPRIELPGSVNIGAPAHFDVVINPVTPGDYRCVVKILTTNDPVLPGTSHSYEFVITFKATGSDQVLYEMQDVYGAPLLGNTVDFLEVPAEHVEHPIGPAPFVQRIIRVYNRPESRDSLRIDSIQQSGDSVFSIKMRDDLIGWKDVTFPIVVQQGRDQAFRIDFQTSDTNVPGDFKDFTKTFTFRTNGSVQQSLGLLVKGRLSKETDDFSLTSPISGVFLEPDSYHNALGKGRAWRVHLGAHKWNELTEWGNTRLFDVTAEKAGITATFRDVSAQYNKVPPEPLPEEPQLGWEAVFDTLAEFSESVSRGLALKEAVPMALKTIQTWGDQKKKYGRQIYQVQSVRNGQTKYYYLAVYAVPIRIEGPQGFMFVPVNYDPNGTIANSSAALNTTTEIEPIPQAGTFRFEVAPNSTARRVFELRNNHSQAVYVRHLNFTGNGFSYFLPTEMIPPNGTVQLTIEFTAPSTAGVRNGQLTFDVDTEPSSFGSRSTFAVNFEAQVGSGGGGGGGCPPDCGGPGPGGEPTVRFYDQGTSVVVANHATVNAWNLRDASGAHLDSITFTIKNDGPGTLAIRNFACDTSPGLTVACYQPGSSVASGSTTTFTVSGMRHDYDDLHRLSVYPHFEYTDSAGAWKTFVLGLKLNPDSIVTIPDLTVRIEDDAGTPVSFAYLNPDFTIPTDQLNIPAHDFGIVPPWGVLAVHRDVFIRNTSNRRIQVRSTWTGSGKTGSSQWDLSFDGELRYSWPNSVILEPNQRARYELAYRTPYRLVRECGQPGCPLWNPIVEGAAFVSYGEVDGAEDQGNVVWIPARARKREGPYAAVDYPGDRDEKLTTVTMKPAAPNEERRLSLAIFNYGTKKLQIGTLRISGPGFSVTQPGNYSIPEREWPNGEPNKKFQISFKSSEVREHTGKLTFTTNDPNQTYELTVKINVTRSRRVNVRVKQGAEDLVNNGSFDPTGSPLFTVFNDGSNALTLSNLQVTGALTVAQTVPSSIPAGGSGTFQIVSTGTASADDPTISFRTSDEDDDEFFFIANSKPVALDDTKAVSPRTAISIPVTDNDYDSDGDVVSLIDNPIIVPPTMGTAVRTSDTNVTYTAGSAQGTDTFQYEIKDGNGRRARAWVTVNIGDNQKPVAEADSATTDVGTAVQIDVTNNDWDPDGETPFLIDNPIVVAPQHGTAQKLGQYSVIYTPAAGYSGADTFQYEIADGRGMRARALVTITVGAPNNKPVAVSDRDAVDKNGSIVINVAANDYDPDGDTVRLIEHPIVVTPNHGGSAIRVSGTSVNYTPAHDFSGEEQFMYEIADGRGKRARATVTVRVGLPNAVPQANGDDFELMANQATNLDVVANDTDPDGDPLALVSTPIASPPSHGTAVRLSDTQLAYRPAAEYKGPDSFDYLIRDHRGGWARATVRLTVVDRNQIPIAENDVATTTPGTKVEIDVVANDSDPDGDPLSILPGAPFAELPMHGSVRVATPATVEYTPASGFEGVDRFVYRIRDFKGGRTTGTVFVSVGSGNHPPIANDDRVSINVGGSAVVNVVVNDIDPEGTALTLTANPIVDLPQSGIVERISGTSFRYTPGNTFTGTDRFSYQVSDAAGNIAVGDVLIFVGENHPPLARSDVANTTVNTPISINVVNNDSDPDSDELALDANPLTVAPLHGTVQRISSRILQYAPTAGYSGGDGFEYQINDGRGGTARATVVLNVAATNNQPPVAVSDEASTLMATPVSINVVANDTDPENQGLALSETGVTVQPVRGMANVLSPSTIQYVPDPDFHGTDAFEYEIKDAANHRARGQVFVTVGSTSAPVARPDSAIVNRASAVDINVVLNDTHPQGFRLSISNPTVTQPAFGDVLLINDQVLRYRPGPEQTGTVQFAYEVTDGQGGRSQAAVSVQVVEYVPVENHPPIAGNDSVAILLGTASVDLPVLQNDVDPDGQAISLMVSPIVVPPQHGTVQRLSATLLRYVPDSGYGGTDSFQYEIQDTKYAKARGTVTIVIHRPPVAVNDSASTFINAPVNINVTANDSDPDGDAILLISAPVVVAPRPGATVTRIDNNTLKYTPPPSQWGPDTFTYQITDSRGATATATVSVNIQNKPPAGVNDTASVLSAITGLATSVDIDVIANDTDPDGHYVKLSNPAATSPTAIGGTITRLNDTTLRYSPKLHYVGTDTFTYTLEDLLGLKSTAIVTVTVQNRAPLPVNDATSTAYNTAVNINVVANDADPENQALSLPANPIVQNPPNGTVSRVDNTTLRYTPNNGFLGQDTFKYQVADTSGATALAQVTVSIQNRAPVTVADSASLASSSVVATINVTANDSDPDGDAVELYQPAPGPIAAPPANGTAQIYSLSQVQYTPRPCFAGTDTFQYRVWDGRGALSTGTVTVSVANDHRPVAVADTITMTTGTSIHIPVSANDCDPDGGYPYLDQNNWLMQAPTLGTVTWSDAGSVQYTPAPGVRHGTDTFKYILRDFSGNNNPGTVTVNINLP